MSAFSKYNMNWQYVVYVKEAPLCTDAIFSWHKRTDKILDDHFKIANQVYLYLDGDIYYTESEVKNHDNLVRRNLGDLSKLIGLIKTITDRFAKKESVFDPVALATASNRNLIKIFENFFLNYQNALTTLYLPIALDRVLSSKLKNYLNRHCQSDKVESVFNALTPLAKDHDIMKYHVALFKLALKKKKLSKLSLEKELDKLAKKFAFLGIKFYLGAPYTKQSVKKQLNDIKNPQAELEKKILVRQQDTLAFKKICRQLKLPGEYQNYVKWLRETIYLRTYRLERISEGEFNSFSLLNEIGKRVGARGEDLVYLGFKEMKDALLGGRKNFRELVAKRKKSYGMISLGKENKFYVEENYKKFASKFVQTIDSQEKITGQVAYAGKATGKVHLIMGDHELNEIKKGEILVTKMTTPDYIFAMQKSAAVVTDVGGVTSHASVVSRELRKPCIIGTKIATQVLKDGDVVEVDADKGAHLDI